LFLLIGEVRVLSADFHVLDETLILRVEIVDDSSLWSVSTGSVIDVRFRLLGGKGGFGALLRNAPAGIRYKKTTNFDSSRDLLTGKRLRHVNKYAAYFFFFALTCPATWVLTFLQREEAERVGGKAEAESRAEARTDRRGEAENCRRRSKKGAVQGIAPAS
jgi:hypothetical protein